MPIGQRWFAWMYGRVDRATRPGTARIRAELVGDLTGDILEIGCGLGANFAHYPAAARVIATDYSEHMLKSARAEAASESVTAAITVEHAEAAALRFPDASFDTVVSTLVLCSVRSQAETLQEIRRVLRPDGELRIWQVWSDPRQLERWWGPPTYPATVVTHEFTAGGRVTYFMTGPEGDQHHGWWRIVAVDPPHQLEFVDGFADENGVANEELPQTTTRVQLTSPTAGRTKMVIASRFPTLEAMEQLVAMGMEEGMTLALGQIEGILEPVAS